MSILTRLLCAGLSASVRVVALVGVAVALGGVLTLQPAAASADTCPNAQYRTGPSAALADCRAYEQVSPQDKNGLDAVHAAFNATSVAAPTGSKFMYQSLNSYGIAQGNTIPSAYLVTRTATGWETDNVTPPTPIAGPPGGFQTDMNFSPDLSNAVYAVPLEPLAPGAQPLQENLFLRHNDGTFSLITTAPPSASETCTPQDFFGALCWEIDDRSAFAGASADYSHVLFVSNDNLTPEALPGTFDQLYESFHGQVSLVGILPDGQPAEGSQPGSGEGSFQTASDVKNAISTDGSRIFFSATADGGAPDPAQTGSTEVYERVAGSSTVEVSAPAAGATPANSTPEPAEYGGASADGSLVFFTSSAELTTDANTGAGNAGNDLYEFNTDTNTLTDLTVDTNPADADTGANVQGVVGASTDGSAVYFVADGQLVNGQGADGQPNLYLLHGGKTTFIATLGANDSGDWTNDLISLQSYVTPDGQHLALTSTVPLTGYDNTDQETGQPDAEVYEYSAPTGELVCASCNPTGAAPAGAALLGTNVLSTEIGHFYEPRFLSDDGSRLFFLSSDQLTPTAVSSHSKVYEYEQDGAGTCRSAAGCVYLLDAATSGDDYFLDASASGDDVFIATEDELVPSDQDQLNDVYDVRVDGGFAASTPPPACGGDVCQGQPPAAPGLPVAGTIAFSGPGNQTVATKASNSTRAARVRVRRKVVRGWRFALSVKVPDKGNVTITGADVVTVKKRFSRAKTETVMVRLTATARRQLKHKRKLRVAVKVSYRPGAGPSSVTVVSVEMKA